jgi:hypothetical protein
LWCFMYHIFFQNMSRQRYVDIPDLHTSKRDDLSRPGFRRTLPTSIQQLPTFLEVWWSMRLTSFDPLKKKSYALAILVWRVYLRSCESSMYTSLISLIPHLLVVKLWGGYLRALEAQQLSEAAQPESQLGSSKTSNFQMVLNVHLQFNSICFCNRQNLELDWLELRLFWGINCKTRRIESSSSWAFRDCLTMHTLVNSKVANKRRPH